MPSHRIRLSIAEACDHAEHAMRGIGYNAEEAHIVAMRRCAATNIPGWRSFSTFPSIRRFKQPRRPIRVLRETEVSVLYDGGNNVGMLVMYHAARGAIAKASAHGFAIVGVTNSWVSGRSAYYVEMIANANLIGIHTAGSARAVAPPGGTRPELGTNPIASGLRSSRGPIVFDMGTSAFMDTDLMYRERMGNCCHRGWRSIPKANRHAIPP
jgi:LDH2 family malate/lactate/ureidoglycolate dehydrogenase